jgi:1,4-alpha-glucan branching enzyme
MIIKQPNGDITFIFDQNSSSPVYLVGDFNNWSTEIEPMHIVEGKWQTVLKLKPGAYQFKYMTIESGESHWYNDWRADAYVKSPFGGENSVVIID